MLYQFLFKRAKILRGVYRTYLRHHRSSYNPTTWWDEQFFTKGISDRQTISAEKNPLTAANHYSSVELLISRHLRNNGWHMREKVICDLGSGSGHWIDFYLSLGAKRCIGVDVSKKSVGFLRVKYAEREDVSIEQGRLQVVLENHTPSFHLVNAIGIMFHLIDDDEWEQTVHQSSRVLLPGGIFVIGGHFGLIDGLNVQFNPDNTVNKRLRSAYHWKRSLRRAGFVGTKLYKNRAYLSIKDTLPENNILIAQKSEKRAPNNGIDSVEE